MGRLTPMGERLRQAIGAAGTELTPNQLADGLDAGFAEARERVRPGIDGCCKTCHKSEGRDFRFGICDVCAFCAEPNCHAFAEPLGELTRCEAHEH